MRENNAAQIHPEMIAGRISFHCMVPFLSRKILTLPAAVIKNIRLIILAVPTSMFTTIVSQRISKLPPPTPRPARNPRIRPAMIEIGIVVSKDI